MLALPNDGSEIFSGQCLSFCNICQSCGFVFEEKANTCGHCKAPRQRCKNKAMNNETLCRVHAPSRYESIYNIVSAKVADTTIQTLIEDGKLRDLTAEFAMAKLSLLDIHMKSFAPQERLEAISTFFAIAEKLQRIESGGLLNSAWNDPLITAMRNKFRQLIGVMVDIIVKYVPEVDTRKIMLEELKDRSKMIGNSVTIKPEEGNTGNILNLQKVTTKKRIASDGK